MAMVLQRRGHSVSLWEYDRDQAERVNSARVNEKFLPGHRLPDDLQITWNLPRAVQEAEICLLSVPFQRCRSVLRNVKRLPRGTLVLSLMKGIEQETLRRGSQICAEELERFDANSYAILSGPTIAVEVAGGQPTSAVIASTSQETATRIQFEFASPALRLYTSDDVVGVELASALKNVIALAAGMCDGMGLGANAKGALLTRGLAEISRLGMALGGDRQTFSGLSGIGDLITTCTSGASRNRYVGEAIGRGEPPDQVLGRMVMVAEGVWTARAAFGLSQEHSIEMPITEAVCRILDGTTCPREALEELMTRDLKAED